MRRTTRNTAVLQRPANTLLESCLALDFGVILTGLGFALLSFAHRSEDMGGLRADATTQAALANVALEADLGALVYDGAESPIAITAGPSSESGRIVFLRRSSRLPKGDQEVEYCFDKQSGVLRRSVQGVRERLYRLGAGSIVKFAIRTPIIEGNGAPARGNYHNILTYRISTRATNQRGQRGLTLVGTVPLLKKASWDTFLFWNLRPYSTDPAKVSDGSESLANVAPQEKSQLESALDGLIQASGRGVDPAQVSSLVAVASR